MIAYVSDTYFFAACNTSEVELNAYCLYSVLSPYSLSMLFVLPSMVNVIDLTMLLLQQFYQQGLSLRLFQRTHGKRLLHLSFLV